MALVYPGFLPLDIWVDILRAGPLRGFTEAEPAGISGLACRARRIDCVSDTFDQVALEVGLQKHVVHAGRASFGRDVFVRIARDQNDRGGDVEPSQPVWPVPNRRVPPSCSPRQGNPRNFGSKTPATRPRCGTFGRRILPSPAEIAATSGRRSRHRRRKSSTFCKEGLFRLHRWCWFGCRSFRQDRRFASSRIDLAQSSTTPARIANRTSSERLPACIFVMTFAR